jgi:hypothetical protein
MMEKCTRVWPQAEAGKLVIFSLPPIRYFYAGELDIQDGINATLFAQRHVQDAEFLGSGSVWLTRRAG